MQYPTYIHNYGCWRSNEGLPDNLEKPSNNFAQLSTSWRLSLHLHVFFRSLEVIYLKGNNFVEIICQAKLSTSRVSKEFCMENNTTAVG